MKETISRKSCHENFSIKKAIYSQHVHWPSNRDKDDSHWIHLYPYPPPSPSGTVRRSALVFYIPITISRDVIHVTDLFLYVFAICSSFTTNFGQIHSSVLKSSCFTYWYLSQFPEMLHMFYTLVYVPCGFVAMFTC